MEIIDEGNNFPKLRTTLQGMPKFPNLFSRKFQFHFIDFLKSLEFLKFFVKLKVLKFGCLAPPTATLELEVISISCEISRQINST